MADQDFGDIVRERLAFISKNKERLIEAWVAETGLSPSKSCLVQQDKGGVLRFWVEEQIDRCMTHRGEIERLKLAHRGDLEGLRLGHKILSDSYAEAVEELDLARAVCEAAKGFRCSNAKAKAIAEHSGNNGFVIVKEFRDCVACPECKLNAALAAMQAGK